jgi:hypothetical protein
MNERATLSAVIVRHRVGATRRPMTGSSGRSSIPEALMIESRGRGVLDRPVKPDDDRVLMVTRSATRPIRISAAVARHYRVLTPVA